MKKLIMTLVISAAAQAAVTSMRFCTRRPAV